MQYMLLMYANESEASNYTPEEYQAAAQAWYAFGKEAEAAGVLLSNNGLSSINDATTVRLRDGKTLIVDGPFAETHEQLGGYYLLDCKDIDEAISWATKIPIAKYGSIEVRPLNVYSQK
ncbi:MAG: YciI family protein [Chitinophagaceae bacterium]|nr:YciI family protein [Anaerolineae bacterium]